MPLLFLFVTLTIFALVVFTLWSVSQAPEGIETEQGFQRIVKTEQPKPIHAEANYAFRDTQAHILVE